MSPSLGTRLGKSLISKSGHLKWREVTEQDVTQHFKQLDAESTPSPGPHPSIVSPRCPYEEGLA